MCYLLSFLMFVAFIGLGIRIDQLQHNIQSLIITHDLDQAEFKKLLYQTEVMAGQQIETMRELKLCEQGLIEIKKGEK